MSTIRVVNLQHTDATEPNIVLESDGTAVFASGITISGGTNLTISGIAEFASGTVSAPTITFIDDNNTGIYEPAVDTVAITTAATERLRVDNSGNVGIGTTSPNAKLEVRDSSSPTMRIGDGTRHLEVLGGSTTQNCSIGTLYAGALGFFTNGVNNERMRIDSSGRLLVGTSSSRSNWANTTGLDPLFQLEQSGNMRASITRTDANQFGPQLWFGKTRGAAYQILSSGDALGEISFMGADGSELVSAVSITAKVDGTPGTNDMPGRLMFSTTADGASSPTERMRINSSGNVGIGTNNPTSSKLTVFETSTTPGAATLLYLGTTGGGGFNIECSDLSASNPDWAIKTFYNEAIVFKQAADERARIDSSGRLLVGTSSAVSSQWAPNLQVVGSDTPCSFVLARNDTTVGTNSTLAAIRIFGNDLNGTYEECARISATSDAAHDTGSKPSRLGFWTTASGASSPTERMRIDRLGRIFTLSSNFNLPLRNTNSAGTSIAFIAGYHSASSITTGGTNSFNVFTNGNVTNTNDSYGAISDIKLKENIVDAGSQWDDFKAVRFRKYNFKEETGHETFTQLGVIAQELEQVCPGLVEESPDLDEEGNDLGTTTKSVKYSILTKKALVALQEAMERIETLEAKVAALEAK